MKSKRSLVFVLATLSLLMLLAFSGLVRAQDATPDPNGTGDMSGMDMSDTPISPEVAQLISQVRQGTADFRNFDGIKDKGYGKLLDCFTNKDIGGMGQHYVNGDYAGDDVVDPMKPEALVYEPTEDGKMNLVAFEYLVFASVWDPKNTGRKPPVLFDRPFHLMTNIPNTPPVWALHIWLWTSNPNGVFADFNPLVFCPPDQPITDMTPKS
jgi:hypothetical protein